MERSLSKSKSRKNTEILPTDLIREENELKECTFRPRIKEYNPITPSYLRRGETSEDN